MNTTLTKDQLRQLVPSAFATHAEDQARRSLRDLHRNDWLDKGKI